MAGIYIHIPFCKQACIYCDFHFSTSLGLYDDMVDALLKEIELRSMALDGHIVDTIYLGGGTPSLLKEKDLNIILKQVGRLYKIHPEVEITLEANPDDLTRQYIDGLHNSGVNRLSVGIQSFLEADLKMLNRSHIKSEAIDCLENIRASAINNYSLDLIFGLPGQSLANWENNVLTALEYDPQHMSCYSLTVEPKTALHYSVKNKSIIIPKDDRYNEMFLLTSSLLSGRGYEHYEISNYAQNGFKSKHNSAYWDGSPYLGVGPSAHGYLGDERYWNCANNAQYIKQLAQDNLPDEREQLTAKDKYNEFLMTRLRLKDGLNFNALESEYPIRAKGFLALADKYISSGDMLKNEDQYYLSPIGKLTADEISSNFFVTD